MKLTPRQLEVVQLIALGMRNKAIAVKLGLTESTVKVYVSRILEQYGAKSRTEVARAVLTKQQDLPLGSSGK